MFGYTGARILNFDLTEGKFSIQTFDEDFARKYLGGNGFAARILYDRLKPGIDPFSTENLVVFAVGPVTDTPFPSTSRAYAATKSPLNGLFFDSTFGGRFAITQKRTGFEAIVISGKAKEPVYLLVDENGARVKPGPLDVAALDRSIGSLVARHASLRTAFVQRDGMPVQLVQPEVTVH